MTNKQGSAIEARRMARRKDEIARDLEVLVQRLREPGGIVRLLAASTGEEQATPSSRRATPDAAPCFMQHARYRRPELPARPMKPRPAERVLVGAAGGSAGRPGVERFVNDARPRMADADARGTRRGAHGPGRRTGASGCYC